MSQILFKFTYGVQYIHFQSLSQWPGHCLVRYKYLEEGTLKDAGTVQYISRHMYRGSVAMGGTCTGTCTVHVHRYIHTTGSGRVFGIRYSVLGTNVRTRGGTRRADGYV